MMLENPESFTKQWQVSHPECDINNEMKLSAMMRWVQEISAQHLEALGLGNQLLWQQGFVYLLSKVELEITARPQAQQKVRLLTKPRRPKGALSFRDVYFMGEKGEELIQAKTSWVLADPVEHRIRRPSELPYMIPIEPGEYDYSWAKKRIAKPTELETWGTREVRYSDMDVNSHMNNAVYSDIVCDALPLEVHRHKRLERFSIHFVSEAKYQERLTIGRGQREPGIWYISAQKDGGDLCFEAQMNWSIRE